MTGTHRCSAAAARLVVGLLLLSACTSGDADVDRHDETPRIPGTIEVAYGEEFTSYNRNTPDQDGEWNEVVLNQVLRGFTRTGPQDQVIADEEFGTFEKVSDDPLVVRYTVSPRATWSDGTAIDCDDLLLTWAAGSGRFAPGWTGADGAPLTGFSASTTSGYEDMLVPECSAGEKQMEVTYAHPVADWRSVFGAQSILPAHVVAQQAGVSDVISAIKGGSDGQLAALAAFYNTGFIGTPGVVDPKLFLSSGPYKISSWDAGRSITLTANPSWWGNPPATGEVIIRFIGAAAQVAALESGEVDVIRPQAAAAVLERLGTAGEAVVVDEGDSAVFEELVFGTRGPFADPDLRRAFALCVPRQQIVNTLVAPVNSRAEVLDARRVMPYEEGYQDVITTSGSGDFERTDTGAARAILEEHGVVGLVVRLGHQTPNDRRAQEVDLIADSCGEAGFDVRDDGSEGFAAGALLTGDFDVAVIASATPVLVSSGVSKYVTGGTENYGGYSSAEVDDLTLQLLGAVDAAARDQLEARIETQLWADLPTLPLYVHPALLAHVRSVTGPELQPSAATTTWNVDEWTRSS